VHEPIDAHTLTHISADKRGEALQIGNDLGLHHESLRVWAVIRKIRQTALPVGGDQAERIPALLIPRTTHPVLFKHHWSDASLLQFMRNRKPGLATSYNHNAVVSSLGVSVHRKRASATFYIQPIHS
jgi:hypothetical protein